jgi:hypothetical protein
MQLDVRVVFVAELIKCVYILVPTAFCINTVYKFEAVNLVDSLELLLHFLWQYVRRI